MDTVTLTIDGRQVTAEKGKTVLQAAIESGIKIPYYCYHPGLGVDGSCRVCIVKIEKMPKLQTSCSTPVAEGMVVSTQTPDVVEARASVFEFLLINHPLDCPVCDKGGECPLQDFSYSFGPNESRMEFLGYHVFAYKWTAFTLSCAVAGFAGGLFAMAQGGAFIQVMSLQWSGVVVLMVLIGGGMVSFWGPVLGTALFFVARDVLGAVTETWLLWYGVMFMMVVMFKPEGLAGMWQAAVARLEVRRAARAAPLTAVPEP